MKIATHFPNMKPASLRPRMQNLEYTLLKDFVVKHAPELKEKFMSSCKYQDKKDVI